MIFLVTIGYRSGIHVLKLIGHIAKGKVRVRTYNQEILKVPNKRNIQNLAWSWTMNQAVHGSLVQTTSLQCDLLLSESLSHSLITQQAVTIFIILFWSWDCSFWIESHSSLTSSRAIPREIVRAKRGAIAFACNWYFMIGKVDLPEIDWSIYILCLVVDSPVGPTVKRVIA